MKWKFVFIICLTAIWSTCSAPPRSYITDGFISESETKQGGDISQPMTSTEMEAEVVKPFRINSLPMISKTYVINLANRTDRMNYMTKQLNDLHIPFTRFEAFDFGKDSLTKNLPDVLARMHPKTKMNMALVQREVESNTHYTWGVVGSWQSHLQIYLDILYNPETSKLSGPFMIMEDDVKIFPEFFHYLSPYYLQHVLPPDWEYYALNTFRIRCFEDRMLDNDRLCQINFITGAGCYLLRNQTVAKKLVELGNSPRLQVPDGYVKILFTQKKINAYALTKSPAKQLRGVFWTDVWTELHMKMRLGAKVVENYKEFQQKQKSKATNLRNR